MQITTKFTQGRSREQHEAADRHCDLMRQGFMRLPAAKPHTQAQVEAGKRHAARINALLDKWEV